MLGSLLNFFQPKIDGVEFMTPEEAKSALDSGEIKVLVDVRTPGEFSQSRLPGALHHPLDSLSSGVVKLEKFKNEEVILYCRTQQRSSMAARYLSGMGFKKLKVITGGISGWAQMGFPLEN